MLREVQWSEDRSYRTASDNSPVQFYMDGLCNSKSFDLLLGYFSSAAINVLSSGFATFLYADGKVRLIANNILSQADKDAIKVGKEGNVATSAFNLEDIEQIKRTLDEYGNHFFECLSWLIANKRIDLKVVSPKQGNGIAHFKNGIFHDGKDYVGFSASCNFTAYGLLENMERLEAFLSWEDSRSTKFTKSIKKDFDNIFNENDTSFEYLDVNDIEVAIKREFGNKSLEELIIQEKELLEKKIKILENKQLKQTFEKVITRIEKIIKEPRFPYSEGPREYQLNAYNNWEKNDYKGIFAMATGTGKTITSLNCVLNEYKQSNNKTYHAIILVPTITLVEQWEKEALLFNFQETLKVSSKYDWEGDLWTLLSTAKRIPTSFIIISTYATFIKDKFQRVLENLPADTIFIADEGHNLASPNVLSRLNNIPLQKRIGLSATPKRIYDPEGTAIMEQFFNDKEPYTYAFPMEKAIKEGILCKYYYYPHIVRLNDQEFNEYLEITKKLAKFYDSSSKGFEKSDIVEMLLLKRKRIIHKAANKLVTTKKILQDEFSKKGNLQYTFVYVPEGLTEEISEDGTEEIEEIKLINQYTREIARINDSITVNQFVSGMADRKEILNQFQNGAIQVVASMKCLDEGVDIPRAENAIFCSSTGNPRQFIQRRGRILRKHPDKTDALIHDLVVIPNYENSFEGSDTFNVERNMVKSELERVMYFASLAKNPFYTEDIFKDVCDHYNLNIYTIQNELKTV